MIAADGVLHTGAGHTVPRFQLRASILKDRSIVVYGPSGSGKSVIVKQVMKALVDHVEQIIVVAPTEPSNHSYEGYVDPLLVNFRLFLPDPKNPKKDDGPKGAVRFLEGVWKRQEMMVAIYMRANQPKVLSDLFARLPPGPHAAGSKLITRLNDRRNRVLGELARQRAPLAPGPDGHDQKVTDINTKFRQMLCLIYKKMLVPAYEGLWQLEDLSEDERYSLMYLQLNPRLLLVLDDCAADLKSLQTKEVVRKFFYQNRHNFVTFVFCCQDDTDLVTNLRKNAFVSFFADAVVCNSNFERGTNQFGKAVKRHVAEIVPDLFQGHRKMAYVREDPARQHFYYLDEPAPEVFRFGSPAGRELCDHIRTERAAMDKDNPFYQHFCIDGAV